MDPLAVCFCVVCVDFVLGSVRIEGTEFEKYLYCSLVFGDGDSLRAFSLQVYGFIGILDR